VTKVIDYMTMGRPIVQFPLPEMSRLCGDSTLYAREGDPADLADKIEQLVDNRAKAEQLGAAARRRALEVLAWDGQVPVLLEAVRLAAAVGRRRHVAVA
jgi:glycosyltransferase involved in cell wall biosynthesis